MRMPIVLLASVSFVQGCNRVSLKDTTTFVVSEYDFSPGLLIAELNYPSQPDCPSLGSVNATLNGSGFDASSLGGEKTAGFGPEVCDQEGVWNKFSLLPKGSPAKFEFSDSSETLSFEMPTLFQDRTPSIDVAASDLRPKGTIVLRWPLTAETTSASIYIYDKPDEPIDRRPPLSSADGTIVNGTMSIAIPPDFTGTRGVVSLGFSSTFSVKPCPVSECTLKFKSGDVALPFTISP